MSFADIVRKNADTFRAMQKAGMLTNREIELLKLAGLDFDEQGGSERQDDTRSKKGFMVLSKSVKTVQERLKY